MRSIVGGALECGHPEAKTLFYDDLLNHATDWPEGERDWAVVRARRPHMQLAMMADGRADDAQNTLTRLVRLLHSDIDNAAIQLLESDYFRHATSHVVGLPAQAQSLQVDLHDRPPNVQTIRNVMLSESVRNMTESGKSTACTVVEELLLM